MAFLDYTLDYTQIRDLARGSTRLAEREALIRGIYESRAQLYNSVAQTTAAAGLTAFTSLGISLAALDPTNLNDPWVRGGLLGLAVLGILFIAISGVYARRLTGNVEAVLTALLMYSDQLEAR
jgi:hypothetical protein